MKRLLATLALPAILAAAAFLWLNHRIHTHAYAPNLTRVHAAAPSLTFTTLDGQPATLPQRKVVVINLWATWCLPCIAEMRTFQPLVNRFRNDPSVTFLFISTSDTPAQIRAFATRNHLDLPFFLATPNPDPLASPSIPTTYVLAPSGILAARQSGAANWSDSTVADFLISLKSPAGAP